MLGTVVFLYGGWPFLTGGGRRAPGPAARDDAADRAGDHGRVRRQRRDHARPRRARPGLLVGAGAPGRDHAAGPLAGDAGPRRRRPARSTRWPRCCRTRPSGSAGRHGRVGAAGRAAAPATWSWSAPGGRVPADGVVVDGEAERRRVDDHRRVAAGRQGPGDRVVAGTVATDSALRVRVDAVGEDTALAGIRRLVEQAQASRSRAQALADRAAALLFYFAIGRGRDHVRGLARCWATGRRGRAHGDRPGHRLPARARPGHPAGDRDLHRAGRAGRDPGQGPAGAGADAHGRRGAVRQDRHADQGPSPRSPASPRRPGDGRGRLLALAAAVEADSEHPLARAIVAAATARRSDAGGSRSSGR